MEGWSDNVPPIPPWASLTQLATGIRGRFRCYSRARACCALVRVICAPLYFVLSRLLNQHLNVYDMQVIQHQNARHPPPDRPFDRTVVESNLMLKDDEISLT
jgi:hypothetical protein